MTRPTLFLLLLLPACGTPAPVPKPKPLAQEQYGIPSRLEWMQKHLGPDEKLAHITVKAVEVYDPAAKGWKACAFNGVAWEAPKGAERQKLRLTGTAEEQVGAVGQEWAPAPGAAELYPAVWCDSPEGVGNGTYKHSVEWGNKKDFVVEVWAGGEDDLKPYFEPLLAGSPMIDIHLHLHQFQRAEARPDPRLNLMVGTGFLMATIAYDGR